MTTGNEVPALHILVMVLLAAGDALRDPVIIRSLHPS